MVHRVIIAVLFLSCAFAQLTQRGDTAKASGNVQTNAAGQLNIEGFGAKGDGATDNSRALTAAVKAACDSGQPLLIPVGTFAFSTPLTVSCPHFELYGASRYGSRLRYSGQKTAAALTLSNIYNPSLGNLTVDADGKADYSIQLTSTHRGMFRDINARSCIVSCVYTDFSVGDIFENIAVSNVEEPFTTKPQNGIALDGTTTASILIDVRVDGVTNAGIYLGNAAQNTVIGGLLEGNAYGIYAARASQDNTVIGTDIECNSKQEVALYGARTTLNGILSSDGGHCQSSETLIEGSGNQVYGGHFNDLTVGPSALDTTLIGATYQTGAVAHNLFRDLGKGTQYSGLINLTAGGVLHGNRLGSAAAGSAVIPAGSRSVEVDTTAVTADSQILVSGDASLGKKLGVTCTSQSLVVLGPPRVLARNAGASFIVAVDMPPASGPFCFSYVILN
jgi:parallel beta-helix repeat protein